MELLPVALFGSSGDLRVRITHAGSPTTQDSRILDCVDGWKVLSTQSSLTPKLAFCPGPPPGIAKFQFYEQTTYDVWIECDTVDSVKLYLDAQDRSTDAKIGSGSLYGSLNWGNYVGTSVVRIEYEGCELRLLVEVRSRKVDYLDDYRAYHLNVLGRERPRDGGLSMFPPVIEKIQKNYLV